MKSFQNWLDFQHYSQHLKNLSNIKHRIPLYNADNSYIIDNSNKLKFRSRTFNKSKQASQSISTNQNQSRISFQSNQKQLKANRLTYLLEQFKLQKMHLNSEGLKENLIIKEISNSELQKQKCQDMEQCSDYIDLQKVNLDEKQQYSSLSKNQQKQNIPFRKTISYNKQRLKFFNISSDDKKTNKIQRSQTGNQKRRNQTILNKFLDFQSNKKIIFNKVLFPQKIKKYNSCSRVTKNIEQQLKVKNNRQDQLKKYLRFSQQKLLGSIHSFLLQIQILSLSQMSNKQLLSFWIEAQTLNQNIKSSHYNFEELQQKSVFLSFVHKPKGAINIKIKYFRKLQDFEFGHHLFIFNKQTQLQESAIIQNKNNFLKAQIKIRGKFISKQNNNHRRSSSNLIKSRLHKKNFLR